MATYYEILGISEHASLQEIRAAFKKNALKYHPDKNPDNIYAEERFKELNNAYQVLSNPQKKAHYDLTLNYARFSYLNQNYAQQTKYSPTSYRKPPPQPNYRYYRMRPQYNPRYDRIGNVWAMGLFITIVLFTTLYTSVNSYLDRQYRESMKSETEQLFDQALSNYHSGDLNSTFIILSKIDLEYTDRNVASFKQMVIDKILEKIDLLYKQESYHEAIDLLELLDENQRLLSLKYYFVLAKCYQYAEDFENAIRTFNYLSSFNYSTITNNLEVAGIFGEKLEDYDQALFYYQKVIDDIERYYKSTYGEAYAIVVKPEITPELHYTAHVEIAQAYLKSNMFNEALDACEWAIFLRPQYTETYELRGQCYLLVGKKREACQDWNRAALRGSKKAREWILEKCYE